MKIIGIIMLFITLKANAQTNYYFTNSIAGAISSIENKDVKLKSEFKCRKQKDVFKFTKNKLYYKSEGKPEGVYIIDKDDYTNADSNHHFYYVRHSDGNKYIIDICLKSNSIWWVSDNYTIIYSITSTYSID